MERLNGLKDSRLLKTETQPSDRWATPMSEHPHCNTVMEWGFATKGIQGM
jgi:hypothetical protein